MNTHFTKKKWFKNWTKWSIIGLFIMFCIIIYTQFCNCLGGYIPIPYLIIVIMALPISELFLSSWITSEILVILWTFFWVTINFFILGIILWKIFPCFFEKISKIYKFILFYFRWY